MLLLLKNYFLFKQVPRETNQNSLSYKLEKFIFFVYILKLFIYVSLTKVTDFQFFVFVFFYFYNFMWLSYLKYKLNINFNLFWCLKNFIFNFINFKCNLFHKNNLKQKILKNQNLLEFNLFNFYNIILYIIN